MEPSADERALWAAIRADPADDLPRLVYADWLEEHGRGERAEFIRVQFALVALPRDRWKSRAGRRLAAREAGLIAAHGVGWLAPARSVLAGSDRSDPADFVLGQLAFRRGFASLRTFNLEQAHRVAAAGDGLEPFDRMFVAGTVDPRRTGQVADVVAWPGAGCVTGLHIKGADDGDIAAVVASPALCNLSSLGGECGPVTDAAAVALAGWPRAGGLEVLDLRQTRVTDAGAVALVDSRFLGRLSRLDVRGTQITPAGLARLHLRFAHAVCADDRG